MVLSVIKMRKGIVTTFRLLIIVLLLSACGKNTNVTWMYYDETLCADAWEHTNNNEVLKDNVTEHFKSKGVKIYEIEIFNDTAPQGCLACTCTTGRRIKVKVKKKEVSTMEANGFFR